MSRGRPAGHRIRVECGTSDDGELVPSRFSLGDRTLEVVEVLDRWHGAGHRYYRVRADDLDLYVLRHDLEEDRWELSAYRRGADRP